MGKKKLVYFAFLGLLACSKFEDFKSKDSYNTGEYYAIKTKLSAEDIKKIVITGPKVMENIGNVGMMGDFALITEIGRGIHIFNNTNPSEPKPVAFLSIPATTGFAAKDSVLLVDNGNDLLKITVHRLDALKFTKIEEAKTYISLDKRTADVFTYPNYPIQQNIYFECADSAKIFVTQWEKRTLREKQKVNCYR